MNFFKNYFLYRVYNKEINYNERPRRRKFSDKIRNIAVILDGNLVIPEDLFLNLGSAFGLSRGKIFMLTYSELKNNNKVGFSNGIFCKSDISFLGKFNNILDKFCSKRYDVLINYYNRNFLPMKLVSLRCKSRISLGFPNVDHRLNDLILNIDITDNPLFLSESEKYLKLIYSGFSEKN